MLPVDHELLTTETILSSKSESATIQDPLCNLSSFYVGKALLAFVAILPDTTIILYPGSHKIYERLHQDYPPRRYAPDLSDILIFHPRLIHCGSRYPDSIATSVSIITFSLNLACAGGISRFLHVMASYHCYRSLGRGCRQGRIM